MVVATLFCGEGNIDGIQYSLVLEENILEAIKTCSAEG